MILQWDNGEIPIGCMGNLVFLHDRVLDRLLPEVLVCASSLAEQAVELADARSQVARERLVLINDLIRGRELTKFQRGRLRLLRRTRRLLQ